jgi:hypothetical protein
MTRTPIAGSVTAILLLIACTRQDPAHTASETATSSQSAPDEWSRADEQTVRLPPDRFSTLPTAIAARLRDLGCTVPQNVKTTEPHNVITGRFISAGNADWAVLCSRNRASSILVFVNGSPVSMIELEPSPDRQWLQGGAGGSIEFSRAIAVASPRYIVEHHDAFGGPDPPPLDHDGINDIFVEKGSVVLYWHQGQWLHLQGAD